MQNPQPFAVYQPVPGQTAKLIFVIRAYSLEAARTVAASMIAGEIIVVALDGSRR